MDLNDILHSSNHDILLIAPHPDDEVIGAGSRLTLWAPRLHVVHVTEGSPGTLLDARNNGFSTGAEYARCRRKEVDQALRLAGVLAHRAHALDFPDQETSFHLVNLTSALAHLIVQVQPEFILTVPYEGGHPDHDSTAFAVHLACRLLPFAPRIIEMSAYHIRHGYFQCADFLPCDDEPCYLQLSPEQIAIKELLFHCFPTQRQTLHGFRRDLEAFRWAPRYNFTQPPHEGTLYYEFFDWGMTGERWRAIASAALQDLLAPEPEAAPA